MTSVENVTLRGALRRELADLVGLDPELLADHARLVDDLGLDSLTMMRVIIWMESNGVAVTRGRTYPVTVGEALSDPQGNSRGSPPRTPAGAATVSPTWSVAPRGWPAVWPGRTRCW